MASERKFVAENIRRVLLKEYFMKETEMAGFGGIDIQRTPMGTRVTLIVERPGMVIGRKGAKIKELTRTVSETYGFDNPQIEVSECRNSAQNPQIMAQKLALALERGWHFRRAGHSTLRRIIESDVKGAQVKLCGKLTGQRHRTEKFKWGHIKFCGEPAITTMDRGYAIAKKKLGLIGVSVDIMRADAHLPDEVRIRDLVELGDLAKVEGDLPGENAPEKKPSEESGGLEAPEDAGSSKAESSEEKRKSKRKQKKEERRKSEDEEEEAAEDKPEEEPSGKEGSIESPPVDITPTEDEVGKETKPDEPSKEENVPPSGEGKSEDHEEVAAKEGGE
ncbi:MAG: 30S ribosomal protein S3 [Thermoplasmatota archaeon]